MRQDDYTESNKINEIALSKFRKTEYNRLLKCGESVSERERCGQALLNYLCEKFHMENVRLHVMDRPQKHRDDESGKTKIKIHGFYCTTRNITIYNKTAKLAKVVAIKAFTETLLHEFIHHYDHYCLKLWRSPHTSGFYHRLSDLQSKLKD